MAEDSDLQKSVKCGCLDYLTLSGDVVRSKIVTWQGLYSSGLFTIKVKEV
jgi:hypothetical protein